MAWIYFDERDDMPGDLKPDEQVPWVVPDHVVDELDNEATWAVEMAGHVELPPVGIGDAFGEDCTEEEEVEMKAYLDSFLAGNLRRVDNDVVVKEDDGEAD